MRYKVFVNKKDVGVMMMNSFKKAAAMAAIGVSALLGLTNKAEAMSVPVYLQALGMEDKTGNVLNFVRDIVGKQADVLWSNGHKKDAAKMLNCFWNGTDADFNPSNLGAAIKKWNNREHAAHAKILVPMNDSAIDAVDKAAEDFKNGTITRLERDKIIEDFEGWALAYVAKSAGAEIPDALNINNPKSKYAIKGIIDPIQLEEAPELASLDKEGIHVASTSGSQLAALRNE